MNLIAGSLVVAAGGERIGRLAGITVNLATNQVVDLHVLGPEEQSPVMVVPVQAVDDIVGGEVVLALSEESCAALPATSIGGQAAPSASARAVAQQVDRQPVLFGATMICLDGPIGPLRRILYDQYSYDIEELVVGTSERLDHEAAVPVAWVRQIHQDRIVLSCSRQEVTTMPPAPEDE